MENSTDQKQPEKKQGPDIPINILRWVGYGVFFTVFILPLQFVYDLSPWLTFAIIWILAHFSSQLNAIASDKNNKE